MFVCTRSKKSLGSIENIVISLSKIVWAIEEYAIDKIACGRRPLKNVVERNHTGMLFGKKMYVFL